MRRAKHRYYPAWSKTDACWAAIGLYERAGKVVEARIALEHEFHQTLADRPYGFLGFVEEILAKLQEPGANDNELIALDKRLSDVRRQSAMTLFAEDLNESPVQVTVVGGDERQAGYDSAIDENISVQMEAVNVDCRHTGWSGRWGPQLLMETNQEWMGRIYLRMEEEQAAVPETPAMAA